VGIDNGQINNAAVKPERNPSDSINIGQRGRKAKMTNRILYKTTYIGTRHSIRVTNLTEGGTKTYEFHHTPEACILAVSAASSTPYELVDLVGSDAKNSYYMTDDNPQRII
jgi:hypothetical protein